MREFLSGCATALITPFDGDGVNFSVLEELIEFQIGGGASALVVLGTTGEPATMSEEERRAVVRFCAKTAKGRVKVIAGAGSNCTSSAVRAVQNAQKDGADGVLVVTPYYNKCTQKGLVAYYRAVCEATELPVVAYNVPARTGVNISPETMGEISELPNLVGLKDACGNMVQTLETAREIFGKCELYSGEDALNLPILCAGGTAAISVLSNLVPGKIVSLIEAVKRGDLAEANAIDRLLLPLAKACFSEVNPIPVKAALAMMGFEVGVPRPPLTPLEPRHTEPLRRALEACGGLL